MVARHKLLGFPDMGIEVWALFDRSAEVYELFDSEAGGDHIGSADTLTEAGDVAREWAESWMA